MMAANLRAMALVDCPQDLGSRAGWTRLDCTSAERVVIFAARRTGSSLLLTLMREHPDVLMHGELYHVKQLDDPQDGYVGRGAQPCGYVFDRRRRDPLPLLRFVQCHGEGHRAVGLKVFRDHTKRHNWAVLTEWCTVCVILARDDVEAQYRSLVAARQSGRWKGKSTEQQQQAAANASLDDGYKPWRANQDVWYRVVAQQLRRRSSEARMVALTYETHLASPSGPDLSPLWRALRLTPPAARATATGNRSRGPSTNV